MAVQFSEIILEFLQSGEHKLQFFPQIVPFFFGIEAGIRGFRNDRLKMQINSNLKAEKYTGDVLQET